jgi:hypothetical protein
MHGTNVKIIQAQQANIRNIYKNTKSKLLKESAAIFFNKVCKTKQITPNLLQCQSQRQQQTKQEHLNRKKKHGGAL